MLLINRTAAAAAAATRFIHAKASKVIFIACCGIGGIDGIDGDHNNHHRHHYYRSIPTMISGDVRPRPWM